MARQYFGTDGIRGRVGVSPMTPDFVLKLGWAAGRVLAKEGKPLVLIGKDTRLSGYMFESSLHAGLAAAGINIRLLGPMPTPAVAYLTRTFRASAGIVISASHNPHYDNGVKFFSGRGMKLPDEVEEEIEAAMALPLTCVKPDKLGKAERVEDAPGRYIEYCKRTIPSGSSLRGLRIVVDCANGAAYHTAPSVFEELGAEVIPISVNPNGCNINDKCGATSLASLQETVSLYRADIGIALDGDADRLMMVDKVGEVVDGDEALAIITKYYQSRKRLRGDVVGTQMSNLGLEVALKRMGVSFQRAKVGDRYVMEMLKEKGGILGGESSGHILVLDRATTGDGTVSALQILQAMVDSGRTLHELKQVMDKYPQTLINVPIEQPVNLQESALIQDAVKTAEAQLGERGRVLLRPSGTEPLIRVMVEAEVKRETEQLAEDIAVAVREAAKA